MSQVLQLQSQKLMDIKIELRKECMPTFIDLLILYRHWALTGIFCQFKMAGNFSSSTSSFSLRVICSKSIEISKVQIPTDCFRNILFSLQLIISVLFSNIISTWNLCLRCRQRGTPSQPWFAPKSYPGLLPDPFLSERNHTMEMKPCLDIEKMIEIKS